MNVFLYFALMNSQKFYIALKRMGIKLIKNKTLFFFYILFFLFISCSSVWGKKFKDNEAMMYGMVYNENDEALAEVKVYIDGQLKAISDIQGRFILKYIYGDILEEQKHEILLSKPGYEKLKESIFYDPMSLLYFIMESADSILNNAERLYDDGNFESAYDEINRLLEVDGKEDVALYMLAIMNTKNGKLKQSLEFLDKMQNKDNIYVEKLRKKIENRLNGAYKAR